MKEKIIAAIAAAAFGSGVCTMSLEQNTNTGNEFDTTTQKVVPKINDAISYLLNCSDPEAARAVEEFNRINAESRIAYVGDPEIGEKVIGVIKFVDKNGNQENQLGINVARIISEKTEASETARALFSTVQEISDHAETDNVPTLQDCPNK